MSKILVAGKLRTTFECSGKEEYWSQRDYEEIDRLTAVAQEPAVCRRCRGRAPEYQSICESCFSAHYAPDVAVEFPADFVELPKAVLAAAELPPAPTKRRIRPPRDVRVPNYAFFEH